MSLGFSYTYVFFVSYIGVFRISGFTLHKIFVNFVRILPFLKVYIFTCLVAHSCFCSFNKCKPCMSFLFNSRFIEYNLCYSHVFVTIQNFFFLSRPPSFLSSYYYTLNCHRPPSQKYLPLGRGCFNHH